ncbi:NAD(P)-dependent alcohol dehydrogenase [Sphingopyxis solisilvae]|uniref:NAD(P)-dependent alcohol dehydrogenase n=1 Tax=Sphingopyxis solisilvae TaxID=1886788 RepID=UPI00189291A7|nr:NAD(P)-dependent alcohol dehydrogenase [Sphingopyxis solisilvae]
MKAVICPRYGGPDVLAFREVPIPEPKAGEVRIKVMATSVTSADSRIRAARFPAGMGLLARPFLGFRGPRQPILGTELAGIVDTVGAGVARYRPGDAVMAFPGGKMGCHAEYRCVAEAGPIAPKPDGLSFAAAATLSFGGSTALHFLDAAAVATGARVLVVGASGAVGSALVQLARHRGAHVTAVCSARNADLVRDLGAAAVIDYHASDFRGEAGAYDVIFETVGNMVTREALPLLRPGGRFVAIAAGLPDMLATIGGPGREGRRVIAGPATEKPEHVQQLADLAVSGALRPVVDKSYAFADIAAAHAYVDTGRKRGSVAVLLDPAAG